MAIVNQNNQPGLPTERSDDRFANIDQLSISELVILMNQVDSEVAGAVALQSGAIAAAISEISKRYLEGGRIIYVGAGTSGRIATLDASEIFPTFGVHGRVLAVMAGGPDALINPSEGAEDNEAAGEADLAKLEVQPNDSVIGIASSGSTPYVLSALNHANHAGALTVGISCNDDSEVGSAASLKIEIVVGPELLAGSTRLKAGTAQKMVLNMISTITMVQAGKTYGNYMVDVVASNKKLKARALKMLQAITGASAAVAEQSLEAHDWNVKSSAIGIHLGLNPKDAAALLERSGGVLARALGERS